MCRAVLGLDVVVLEARTRGSGQSGRRPLHLLGWNDDFYHVVGSTLGWAVHCAVHGAVRTGLER